MHRTWGAAAFGLVCAGLAVALIAVAAVTLVSAAGPAATDQRASTPPSEQWTTTSYDSRGVEVSLPAGWQLSTETLTPFLSDPRELLSAGTFPLTYREGRCSQTPDGALQTMRPTDAFVTIQERGRGSAGSDFLPRPSRFADRAEPERSELTGGCLDQPTELVEFRMPFTDAGRYFYAIVVVGPETSDRVRSDAFAILDRLRFDSGVPPDWTSGG